MKTEWIAQTEHFLAGMLPLDSHAIAQRNGGSFNSLIFNFQNGVFMGRIRKEETRLEASREDLADALERMQLHHPYPIISYSQIKEGEYNVVQLGVSLSIPPELARVPGSGLMRHIVRLLNEKKINGELAVNELVSNIVPGLAALFFGLQGDEKHLPDLSPPFFDFSLVHKQNVFPMTESSASMKMGFPTISEAGGVPSRLSFRISDYQKHAIVDIGNERTIIDLEQFKMVD